MEDVSRSLSSTYAIEEMQLDFMNKKDEGELVAEMEDKYLKSSLAKEKRCTKFKIHDVYGDGNCLYYCLLVIIKLYMGRKRYLAPRN